jgi:hypothetical protein
VDAAAVSGRRASKEDRLAASALLARLCGWCASPRRWPKVWASLAATQPPTPFRFAPGTAEFVSGADRRLLVRDGTEDLPEDHAKLKRWASG